MKRALVIVALTACAPSLTVPDGVSVVCATDADCFSGQCIENVCVVLDDTTPPRLVNAHAASDTTITLSFNEPLGDSATDSSGYVTSPPLAFTQATLSEDQASIDLEVPTGLGHDVTYTINVTLATDIAGNRIDASAATATFGSFFGEPSLIVPSALAPRNNAAAPNLTATLTWLPVPDAETYTVEVATAGLGFSPLAIPPIVVRAPATQTTVTVPSAITYEWRVRADVSPPETYDSGSFDALGSTLYVYCPTGGGCDANTPGQSGNIIHPLLSIQAAVILAQSLGATTVAIAGRGGADHYNESVLIRDRMVSLAGGYDPGFTTVDTAAHPSVIEAFGAVIELDNAGATRIEGLTIISQNGSASPTGIAVSGCSGAVTVANTTISVVGAEAGAIGLSAATATAGCTLEAANVTINATGPTPTAIAVTGASLIVSNATLTVDSSTGEAVGIAVDDHVTGTSHIDIGPATIGVTGTPTVGVSLSGARTGDYTVHDSVIRSSDGSGIVGNFARIARSQVYAPAAGANGIFIPAPQRTIVNDSIVVAGAYGVQGANVAVGNTLIAPTALRGAILATNNLLVASFTCIEFEDDPQYPDMASMQNNAFAVCSTAVFTPAATYTTVIDVEAQDNTTTLSGQHRRISNNISTSQIASDIFVSPATDDYHLEVSADAAIKGGGKDPTGSDCGTAETMVSCGGSAIDIYGATRSAPFSIGASQAN